MNPTEAQEISTSPDEVQDLQDDLVIHQQTEPEPEGEITKDIESNKPKRPRSEKQKAAFEKARKVLAEKRAAKAATKSQNKAKPGRPPKVKEVNVGPAAPEVEVDQVAVSKPAPPRKGRKPKVRYVEMMPSSSSETESEPDEVVYVQRKKTKRKTKKKQDTRLVYVEDSSSSSDDDHTFPPPLTSLYSFV